MGVHDMKIVLIAFAATLIAIVVSADLNVDSIARQSIAAMQRVKVKGWEVTYSPIDSIYRVHWKDSTGWHTSACRKGMWRDEE